jgi:hypothetical protein
MARLYFEETQMLRDNRWVWILVIIFTLITFLPLLDGLYWQLAKGEPWGNKPLSDNGLIFLFLTVLVAWSLGAYFLLAMKLETKVDEHGFHYKFFPRKPKWHIIQRNEIAEYKIEALPFFRGGKRVGYHRNIITNTRTFRIGGKKQLSLKLGNGQHFIFGTKNPEGLEHAMNKMIHVKEIF